MYIVYLLWYKLSSIMQSYVGSLT